MPLHIHRAERADALAVALGEVLAEPLSDPFAAEVVAVPAKGVERWLTQQLSARLGATGSGADGIAANIRFPAPASLIAELRARMDGFTAEDDPWSPERMVWTVLDVVDASLSEPWCSVLARHLGASSVQAPESDHRSGRRYATAAHLAALFDSYGSQRPWLIEQWARGCDTDGAGQSLPDDLSWQPALWRRVRAHLGVPSPAERLNEICERLRAEPGVVDLPARVSLFGASRLPADQLAVVAALAAHRDMHLWLPHPSPAMWDALAEHTAVAARSADTSATAVVHPLSRGLARDIRELQQRLPAPDTDTHHQQRSADIAHDSADSDGSVSLLRTMQAHIRDDKWPPTPDSCVVDDSVQVHACHGPARQVEVLRECLLGLFAADPTLEPRDVLIMCPEVEAYAPLIRATFGHRVTGTTEQPADEAVHPGHRLRVRLADRGRGVTNPLLAVVAVLLELADGRVTVTEVLDLAAAEPVRRRCGFDDDDIERLREWAAESGARWGVGQRQRQAFGLGDFAQNTLNSAVDRILLGVTAGETSDDWLDLALPLSDVDSNDVDLAGRFAEFVDRLAVGLRDLRGPRPASEWATILARALDLLTEIPQAQAWQRTEARRELAAATAHAGEIVLRLDDVETLLADRLAAKPTRANFRTGELTVCTMVPMRSVPHRVVVLLGVDDEVFPRSCGVDGENILARAPQLGERDPRSEDRQLLLDAVGAAGEKLLLVHTGADPVSGAHCPPAVPVAELLDVLRAHVGVSAGSTLVQQHPLQAFDSRNFAPQRPFSFDTVSLAGAVAATGGAQRRPEFLTGPLTSLEPADISVAELVSFVEHPVRGFLWQRLGLRVPDDEDDIDDRLPIELDGLATWALGERMLSARLTGADRAGLRAAEWRRGTLPPFGLGSAVLGTVEDTVDTLVDAARPDYRHPARVVDIALDLGGGRRLTGTVPDVHGDVLVRTTYSRVAAKHRVAAWISLLAVAATEERPWRAVITGRGRLRRNPVRRCVLTAPSSAEAMVVLRELVAFRDAGLREPLPVATAATAAYAERRFAGDTNEDAFVAADREFLGGSDAPGRFGEHTDRHLRYVWGAAPRLQHLVAAAAPAGEPVETTRFGALARRLWVPLLRAEQQEAP